MISTSPAANDQLSAGSTVYVTVSSGPEIGHVEMPNLVGLTEDAAISKLESLGLSYGGSDRVSSDLEAGTVIGRASTHSPRSRSTPRFSSRFPPARIITGE